MRRVITVNMDVTWICCEKPENLMGGGEHVLFISPCSLSWILHAYGAVLLQFQNELPYFAGWIYSQIQRYILPNVYNDSQVVLRCMALFLLIMTNIYTSVNIIFSITVKLFSQIIALTQLFIKNKILNHLTLVRLEC